MRSPDPHRTKDDEEVIATWGLDLDKILCIFDVCPVIPCTTIADFPLPD